jgi:hypothetical protein
MTYRVATFGTDADGTIVANYNEFAMEAAPFDTNTPKSVLDHFVKSEMKLIKKGYRLIDYSEVSESKYDCGDKWKTYKNATGDIRTVAIWTD